MSQDTSAKIDVIKHLIKFVKKNFNRNCKTLIDLDPTSPLRSTKDIKQSIKFFQNQKNCDTLISGYLTNRNPYFNLVIKDKKENIRVCIDSPKVYTSRQKSPQVFALNSSIYIYDIKKLLLRTKVISNKTLLYEMPQDRSLDIDSKFDLKVVRKLIEKNNIVILGGSGLIGDAVIKNLIKKKFNIILIDITLSNQNKNLYKTKKIEFIKFDLTKINNHKKLVSGIFKKHLFINAFVNCSYPSKVKKNKINPKKIDSNKFIKNLNNHLFSFYNLSFLFCEFMAKQKYGSIVNLSSIYGSNGPKFSIYKGLKIKCLFLPIMLP